ncbi:DNA-3-methyladenine glycosylase family protein [Sandaracinobacteroides hominis]|uniref:DNA-3-methyladenine glycosylase family protein n=1 Tax=Sandaracinobacteroides hominis TaxID=2780086 RepID=UPI0018F5D445|nr:DNA-3-methyladenine glycosylase 2 family protein [Sandaracinobacteroides hominis]
MGLNADRIAAGLERLKQSDARFAEAAALHGLPEPRIRAPGYETLLRAIVSQQVSTAAAASIWRKLETQVGDLHDPLKMLAVDADALRAAGLSRMKASYALSLAGHVTDGSLPLHALPEDDEEAIRLISSVRGIGRWSAEIYLLFAEGRGDVFPAGDLAVQVQAGKMFGDGSRPSEKTLREMAEAWRPERGVAALFLWHCYNAPPL